MKHAKKALLVTKLSAEARQLAHRKKFLMEFACAEDGSIFEIPAEHRRLLLAQLCAMETYEAILNSRIDLLKGCK